MTPTEPSVDLPALAQPPERVKRVVYLGTPEIAVPPLRALHGAGVDVVLVVTAPDKRRGRGSKATPTPVKAAAQQLGLTVSHDLADVLTCGADLGVVVAFGQLIPGSILEKLAMVNIHFSLLPRWRGAAPVERAILDGDDTTGVCLMALERGLDTGGVYRRAELPVGDTATLVELWSELSEVGSRLLVEALDEGLGDPDAQTGEVTYAKKLTPDEFRLSFSESAQDIHRRVRVGRAWCEFRGKRLKINAVRSDPTTSSLAPGAFDGVLVGTGDGTIELLEVQPEGKGSMAATAWLNGARPETHEQLS